MHETSALSFVNPHMQLT